MLQKIVDDQRFAFADLILVLISGAIGMIKIEAGFWFFPIALVPWLFRALAGRSLFQRTRFDWLIFIFLLTAVVACFAAYDKSAASEKFFFILISILLYYALCGQPRTNFASAATVFFIIGVGISVYYFLTCNFVSNPTDIPEINRVVQWLMDARPELTWLPIPSGYVPGLVIITTSFIIHWLINSKEPVRRFLRFIVLVCFAIVLLAILFVKSASVWLAILSTAGIWVLWKLFLPSGLAKSKAGLWSWLVLLYLMLVMALLYVFDPIASANPNDFGFNSRSEIFFRGISFLRDYPISGAGLASFPGLYSQYVLGIPYFYFSNSYNVFLDVAIEQGLLGGFVFLFIYLNGIFHLSRKVQDQETGFQYWLAMFILIFSLVHGLMQDYLYNDAGTALLFFPVAMSVTLGNDSISTNHSKFAAWIARIPIRGKILIVGVVTALALIGALLNGNILASVWYSNWGALQLEQVELVGFPEAGWSGLGIIPKLRGAEISLRTSLRLDPENLTANHRLGLTYMLYRDFDAASKFLETAYAEAPYHRGIKKSLGYSYLWMGDVDQAQKFLAEMPEINGELGAYYWWWELQDRDDLAKQAHALLKRLNSTIAQP